MKRKRNDDESITGEEVLDDSQQLTNNVHSKRAKTDAEQDNHYSVEQSYTGPNSAAYQQNYPSSSTAATSAPSNVDSSEQQQQQQPYDSADQQDVDYQQQPQPPQGDMDEQQQQLLQAYAQQLAPGVQYLAYMFNNGTYEPVLLFLDENGQPQMQPAPQYQEQLNQALIQQQQQQQFGNVEPYAVMMDPATQTVIDPNQSSSQEYNRYSSSSGGRNSTGEKKKSVSELAKTIGLLKNEHKEWRFRDQKRTLLSKLTPDHQKFIESNPMDDILLRRLPHRITPSEFAKRIWLLVFHTVVADGTTPKFWDRVTNREYLQNHLEEEFLRYRSVEFAEHVHEAINHHSIGVQQAIDFVQSNAYNHSMMPAYMMQGGQNMMIAPTVVTGDDGSIVNTDGTGGDVHQQYPQHVQHANYQQGYGYQADYQQQQTQNYQQQQYSQQDEHQVQHSDYPYYQQDFASQGHEGGHNDDGSAPQTALPTDQ